MPRDCRVLAATFGRLRTSDHRATPLRTRLSAFRDPSGRTRGTPLRTPVPHRTPLGTYTLGPTDVGWGPADVGWGPTDVTERPAVGGGQPTVAGFTGCRLGPSQCPVGSTAVRWVRTVSVGSQLMPVGSNRCQLGHGWALPATRPQWAGSRLVPQMKHKNRACPSPDTPRARKFLPRRG